MSDERGEAGTRHPPVDRLSDRPDGFDGFAHAGWQVRRCVDVTVGRGASDYLQLILPDSDSDAAPESAVLHPAVSDFARELLERIEVANERVEEESNHLDVVEQLAEGYLPAERPWLRLLP